MKFMRDADKFEKVLSSMCNLPLAPNDTDLSSAKIFSSLALGFILEKKSKRLLPDTILLSLTQVHALMELNHVFLWKVAEIMTQIVQCQ